MPPRGHAAFHLNRTYQVGFQKMGIPQKRMGFPKNWKNRTTKTIETQKMGFPDNDVGDVVQQLKLPHLPELSKKKVGFNQCPVPMFQWDAMATQPWGQNHTINGEGRSTSKHKSLWIYYKVCQILSFADLAKDFFLEAPSLGRKNAWWVIFGHPNLSMASYSQSWRKEKRFEATTKYPSTSKEILVTLPCPTLAGQETVFSMILLEKEAVLSKGREVLVETGCCCELKSTNRI